jgi:hypothetical protein
MQGDESLDTAEATPESTGVPQDVIDKIDSVFSQASAEDADVGGGEPKPVTPDPRKNEARRVARVKAEQAEELDEEGKTGPNNPEGLEEAGDEDPNVTATETEEKVPAAEQTETPPASESLDPFLRYAAQQAGMKDDRIDKLFAADPELANETFQTLADAQLNLSRQLAASPAQQATPPVAQQQAPASKLDDLYADLKTFAEENGDAIVERLLKPLKDEVIEPVRRMQAALEVSQQNAVRAEAQSTLADLSTKFKDVYGEDGKANPIQQQTRQNLANLADQIRAGAKLQGKEMSVKDALTRAHSIVTADRRDQAVRNQVKEQVQKRSKQITARPTARQTVSQSSGKRTEQTASDAYERRAAELGLEL